MFATYYHVFVGLSLVIMLLGLALARIHRGLEESDHSKGWVALQNMNYALLGGVFTVWLEFATLFFGTIWFLIVI